MRYITTIKGARIKKVITIERNFSSQSIINSEAKIPTYHIVPRWDHLIIPNYSIKMIQVYRQSNKLHIAHLTAIYDENLDRLVYCRKLEDGPESSQYGLEVCKSLNIDKGFIDRANVIRRQLEEIPDLFHTTKKSRYNNTVYMDKCVLCGSQQNLHTHHLREQSTADQNGFIGHVHNLVILCQECHRIENSTNTQWSLFGAHLGETLNLRPISRKL